MRIILALLDIFSRRGGLLFNQHTRGKWRVLYSDGQRSQPMHFWVARDYAKLFDGKLIMK